MDISENLRRHGCRVTKPRLELLKVLADFPLTVQEIYVRLEKRNKHIDLASVYRSLELFADMGIVNTIDLGEDKKRYELVGNSHHHHVVCTECKSIQDVAMDEQQLLASVKIKSKFKITSHSLEFFGLCENCQHSN
ncbi:MAG: Fur family transcriptional regulator [Patescibacteria group bacterium]|jgi:Fur family ferric uptake transcriptional regulator